MSEVASRQRFLIISNGHGEDAIAAQLIAQFPPQVSAEAYPMIGSGKAYDGICPIVGPRATLASEGWRNVKGSLRRDVVNGGLRTIPPALKFLRAMRGRYDRIIVVGDMVGVLACLFTGNRDLVYLDVYKTGAARLYSALERQAIKRACALVFCRAEALTVPLRQSGVDARAAGNLMMDTIPRGDYDAASRRSQPLAVTLLPGSRALTGESFALQIAALRRLPAEKRPDIFLAVAGSVGVEELARAAGLTRVPMLSSEPDDLGTLSGDGLVVHMARGRAMGNLLDQSDVVLSQAGTASIQSLGLGKPVITFVNPRDRRSRFEDEQKLFGAARVVVDAEAGNVSMALGDLLGNAEERARLGAIGRERIGGPGALDEILGALGLSSA
ncbi:hypothetical protein NIM87_15625 [Devosia sp. XJ19-1]|uniref:Uncharacterized protein n=1 Tax=Devosia ureilytica TaxID=2952754 RepID=A0A9Q4FUE2_9HYPH|nr:hypothetical protein [Devosia ureilytica]MCP8884939.1 hypothetical protein [Devosia ureilytica]MCP8888550.1 hypothetical protein [Devosia ureilytica]